MIILGLQKNTACVPIKTPGTYPAMGITGGIANSEGLSLTWLMAIFSEL